MKSISDYIKLCAVVENAKLITPQSYDVCDINIARFTRDNVEKLVSDTSECGIYVIGTLMPRMTTDKKKLYNEFRVCYFGRSDNDVISRLHDHLRVGGKPDELHIYDDELYFSVWACDSPQESYDKECELFDLFFSKPDVRREGNGYTNSKDNSHDAREVEKSQSCPYPNIVYVDNSERPNRP